MVKYPEQKLKKEWIYSEITPEIAEWSESFGKFLCAYDEPKPIKKPLTTGQLRKFFGEVKRIESNVEKNKEDIVMLKPLLAYAVGRDKNNSGKNKTRIEEFAKEVTTAVDAVINGKNLKSDFKTFVKLLESIVAYHKYYGGKENSK